MKQLLDTAQISLASSNREAHFTSYGVIWNAG